MMATSRWFTSIDTPLGAMHALADDHALAALTFDASPDRPPYADARRDDAHPLLVAVRAQLRAFFDGALVAFDLPLAPAGTAFDREVWRALCTIPYGATWSYRELAQAIGRPTAMRAVGAANGRNPIAIAIPCHRVIGADGTLTGYAGGLPRKRALLALEARVQPPRHDLLALARE